MNRGTKIEVSGQRLAAMVFSMLALTQVGCVTVNVGGPSTSSPEVSLPTDEPASPNVAATPTPTSPDGEVLRRIHALMDGRTYTELTKVTPEVMMQLREIDELYRTGLADVVHMRLAVARVMNLD